MESTKKPRLNRDGITIHSKEDFEGMRRAGRLAAEILDMIGEHVQPGVTTDHLDQLCHDYMAANDSVPATLGYRGYPKSSCISLNHVVCHGIPSDKKLKDGDILNIDVTCILDGWYGDNSRMYVAGKLSRKAERLIQVTHDALMLGIDQVKPGNTFGDIGAAIQRYAEAQRCSVVRDFCGHGLGRVFHAPPNVLHYGNWGYRQCSGRGHVLYDRAHGKSGQTAHQDFGRRLDRRDQRQVFVRAVRTLRWCNNRWL